MNTDFIFRLRQYYSVCELTWYWLLNYNNSILCGTRDQGAQPL